MADMKEVKSSGQSTREKLRRGSRGNSKYYTHSEHGRGKHGHSKCGHCKRSRGEGPPAQGREALHEAHNDLEDSRDLPGLGLGVGVGLGLGIGLGLWLVL